MRTTLSIDDEVLAFARAKAERDRTSIGKVISTLARDAIAREQNVDHSPVLNGISLLPVRNKDAIVTLDIANTLRNDHF